MKLSGISILILIVFGLLVLQSIGGVLQIQSYRKAVRRMHQLGNVGMGQRRGKFFDGHVAGLRPDNLKKLKNDFNYFRNRYGIVVGIP